MFCAAIGFKKAFSGTLREGEQIGDVGMNNATSFTKALGAVTQEDEMTSISFGNLIFSNVEYQRVSVTYDVKGLNTCKGNTTGTQGHHKDNNLKVENTSEG